MEELEGFNFLEALWHWLLPGVHLSVDMLTSWFVVILLALVGGLAMRRASVRPTGLQNALELILEWLSDLSVKIMGHEGPRFLPFFATLFLFIVVSNLLGLVPGFKSPTSNVNLNAGMAILVALLTQFFKIRYQGFSGYLKHFCGPPYWLAPLFIPMRIIEELARPLSLTMRLFGNILAKEIILAILLFLIVFFFFSEGLVSKLLLPVPLLLRPAIILLGVLVSFVQAMVFTALAMVYIGEGIKEH